MADHPPTTNSPTAPSDTKTLVAASYDHMAEQYLSWTLTTPSQRLRYLSDFLSHIPPDSTVLELGCAAGTPILETLVGHPSCTTIYANDISTKHIEMAQARCPTAKFLPGDMMALDFADGSLDGVVAFFSIFHLPREEQRTMFAKIASWLKVGGAMVFNLAGEEAEDSRQEFFGTEMFWSSFDVATSRKMVEEVGLEVVRNEVLVDENLNKSDPDHETSFSWFFVRKPAA
ncbi:unnamed protein product [Zymoseptoria tritici ST99CH_3D7]|uniref:Methyltransferase domain-containing protein n=1 Tax=Zymoseptoria tritici (strain ST99CH_3D7) TaxID=1276538 RepID=A0A1X7RU75_ZYMT9|nr:unnamed protein product [Zymoseptoria tritici ST99CH_3D7]